MADLPPSPFFDVIKRRHDGPGPAIAGRSTRRVQTRTDVRSSVLPSVSVQGLSNVPYLADSVPNGETANKLKLLGELFGVPAFSEKIPEGWIRTKSGKLWCVALPERVAPHAYISAEVRPASVKLRIEAPEARRRRLYDGFKQNRSLPREVRSGFTPGAYNDIEAFCHDLTQVLTVADLSIKSTRGEITEFSEKSRVRLQSACADLQALGVKPGFMFTLTYPGAWQDAVPDGKTAKRHLQAMRKRLTRYLKGQGFSDWSALWFTEFQKRGAPHFHIIGWGPMLKYADMRRIRRWSLDAWAKIINHPDPLHRLRGRKAGTKFEKMRAEHFGYAATYAKKMTQKTVPEGYRNVGRFWGLWNYRLPVPVVLSGSLDRPTLFKLTGFLSSALYKDSDGKSSRYTERLFREFCGPNAFNELLGGEFIDTDFKPDTTRTVFGAGASAVALRMLGSA